LALTPNASSDDVVKGESGERVQQEALGDVRAELAVKMIQEVCDVEDQVKMVGLVVRRSKGDQSVDCVRQRAAKCRLYFLSALTETQPSGVKWSLKSTVLTSRPAPLFARIS